MISRNIATLFSSAVKPDTSLTIASEAVEPAVISDGTPNDAASRTTSPEVSYIDGKKNRSLSRYMPDNRSRSLIRPRKRT